ncbi:unnamed protein product [Arabis nemorensis]|uniref:CASP-like protein n=1 Tax=Arabis nemorensis TaxID=586526 RepID=A0A565BN69_9BRAS|nr:unnamed protein product [Arabis nemorensis]
MRSPGKSMSPPREKSLPPTTDTSMAIVTFDKSTTQFSSSPSPPHSLNHSSESEEDEKRKPKNPVKAEETPSPIVVSARVGSGRRSSGQRSGAVLAILRRSKREEVVKFSALGFRLSELVLALISFSIMAADKTQGWSGDSFDRYKEYRFCLSVNVVAFVYSSFQACDLAYHLVKEKHLISHHLRPLFEFIMDQASH